MEDSTDQFLKSLNGLAISSKFTDNMDLFSIVLECLDMDSLIQVGSTSKAMHALIYESPWATKIWDKLFRMEFGFPAAGFPDLRREMKEQENGEAKEETDFELFQKAFMLYKEIRHLLKQVIVESIRCRNRSSDRDFTGLNDHLMPFDQRKLNPLIQRLGGDTGAGLTLEYVCFHKNWKDKMNATVEMVENQNLLDTYGSELYDFLDNMVLLQTEFQDRVFELILLSAPSVRILRQLGQKFRGIPQLPFLHLVRCPGVIVQDEFNHSGFGHRALIYLSMDRRKSLLVAGSIVDYFQNHIAKLKSNWYRTTRNGLIETFPGNPEDPEAFGSSKITNNIRVQAAAQYAHLASEFHSLPMEGLPQMPGATDSYFFSYQITIDVVTDDEDEDSVASEHLFYPCRLERRTWRIQRGDQVEVMKDQPGVVGEFPIARQGMQPFIYQSQCHTSVMGTVMSGHFTFRYLEGPKKGEEFNVEIGEFTLKLPTGAVLFESPAAIVGQHLVHQMQ